MTNLEALQFMIFWVAIGMIVELLSVVAIRKGWGDNNEEANKALDEVIADLKRMGPGLTITLIILVAFIWPVAFLPRSK